MASEASDTTAPLQAWSHFRLSAARHQQRQSCLCLQGPSDHLRRDLTTSPKKSWRYERQGRVARLFCCWLVPKPAGNSLGETHSGRPRTLSEVGWSSRGREVACMMPLPCCTVLSPSRCRRRPTNQGWIESALQSRCLDFLAMTRCVCWQTVPCHGRCRGGSACMYCAGTYQHTASFLDEWEGGEKWHHSSTGISMPQPIREPQQAPSVRSKKHPPPVPRRRKERCVSAKSAHSGWTSRPFQHAIMPLSTAGFSRSLACRRIDPSPPLILLSPPLLHCPLQVGLPANKPMHPSSS